jgi:hypothetical protein
VAVDENSAQLLSDALDRARKLLTNIRNQQQELLAAPKRLPAGQLAEGQQALENAAGAAQRTINTLESALKAQTAS